MKNFAIIFCTIFCLSPLHAVLELWTNKDGKKVQLDLTKVIKENDEKVGIFKTANGQQFRVKASSLSATDAKRLDQWRPKPNSAFDDIFDGNLVKIDGKKFVPYDRSTNPAKYFVFYYTASWCGPCQAFTPSLVAFYNKYKNNNFEIVLVTSDQSEAAMEKYASDKKMPWPQLNLRKAQEFKRKYSHGVSGIPTVVVCDLQGKIITTNGTDLETLQKLVK